MAEKILNTRILMKIDTLENWSTSALKLKEGELAFATVAASAGNGLEEPVVMVKIGTAEEKTFSELPWAFHAKASDVLAACKTEAGLKTFINGVLAEQGVASNSAMQELAGKVTAAENKITGLENELNTAETGLKARMTAAEGDIVALEGLVGSKTVALQIQEAITALDLANAYEVKGEAAKVQTALNEYKTANDAAVQKNASDISGEIARAKAAEETNANAITAIKDGTTIDSFKDVEEALAGKEAAGEAAKAQTAAQNYADGLNTAMNTRVEALEAVDHSHANKAELDKIVEGDKAKWDAMEQNANDYTDGKIADMVGSKTVGIQISEAITGLDLANTYEPKGEAAKVQSALNTHASEAAAAYETKADASGKLTEAKGYTDTEVAKVQGEVDALETYIGTIPNDYTEENVIAYINKKAEETLSAAQGGSSETAASVKQQLDNYKSANDTRVKAAEDAIDAIEADYLKAADKTELQGAIDDLEALVGTTEVSKQITAVTDPLAARVKAVEDDYLKAADKTELTNAIATAKQEAIATVLGEGTDEDFDTLKEVADWILSDTTGAAALQTDVAAIKADYLKAADKTELEGKITAAHNAANAAQGEVDALEGVVATKAAQADHEALAGRVSTVEGDLNAENTGLKARMTAAEADIDALETKVGGDTVAKQIEDAIEALKIGDYAKAADLTAAINQHNTDKAALEAAIALKANDADLAAIAKTGNVNDLVQTTGDVLIFDCGSSAV